MTETHEINDSLRRSLIDRLIRRTTDVPYDGNIALNQTEWDWPSGVGLYGIYQGWKFTGESYYLDYLKKWVDEHLHEADRLRNVNRTAPILVVHELHALTGLEQCGHACEQRADWLLHAAPRTREGGFEHTVSDPEHRFPEQMWADTLFMACLFLAKMGKGTGNAAYTEEALRQLQVHVKALQDSESGLFYHAYSCETRNWLSGAHWGRANAWMLAAGMEMLDHLPDFPERERVIAAYVKQAEALQTYQRKNGMFGTLLDHEDAYDEASATAGIAYGLKRGIRSGFLPVSFQPVADRAELAVMLRINGKGELTEVSHGTDVKRTLAEYKTVPIVPAFWGQGLALMMLSG
ncbi:glycoside hydrolase family 88/105 protein [Gorillibacterium massiliense]|uniref:glycoside hydrolase family 88/105 protein n=1 Tax=Gorillibacterium massiliense TaxID=1280390 RepID=UPI0004B74E3B|nr:glycoside hydrolase family 88 protein [Gorillibacterium massiliense]